MATFTCPCSPFTLPARKSRPAISHRGQTDDSGCPHCPQLPCYSHGHQAGLNSLSIVLAQKPPHGGLGHHAIVSKPRLDGLPVRQKACPEGPGTRAGAQTTFGCVRNRILKLESCWEEVLEGNPMHPATRRSGRCRDCHDPTRPPAPIHARKCQSGNRLPELARRQSNSTPNG